MKPKSTYHKWLRISFFILCGGISQAVTFGAESEAKSTPAKSAGDAGWELVFQDDFDRIGFYFYTAAKVSNVKVYTKRLPDGLDMD